jgi:hypothetical protein
MDSPPALARRALALLAGLSRLRLRCAIEMPRLGPLPERIRGPSSSDIHKLLRF